MNQKYDFFDHINIRSQIKYIIVDKLRGRKACVGLSKHTMYCICVGSMFIYSSANEHKRFDPVRDMRR